MAISPPLPKAYAWLAALSPLPRMVQEAINLLGTIETPGAASSPTIMGWVKELDRPDIAAAYTADSVPWCGLFLSIIARRAGKDLPASPLLALSWSHLGQPSPQPGLGDVLTFKRDGGGHVALYVGEDDEHFHVIGGNQADKVCFARFPRTRLFAARRPLYNLQPVSVKPFRLAPTGIISVREQ